MVGRGVVRPMHPPAGGDQYRLYGVGPPRASEAETCRVVPPAADDKVAIVRMEDGAPNEATPRGAAGMGKAGRGVPRPRPGTVLCLARHTVHLLPIVL